MRRGSETLISKHPQSAEIHIRRAERSDLTRIDAIEHQSFNDPYPLALLRDLFHMPSSLILVAEIHREVVGFVIASVHRDLGHIISIATHPIERRKTVGRTLMRAVLANLTTRNVTTVRLEVRRSNVEAQRFYEQMGFRHSHQVARYYGDEDAWVYVKHLR
jgi:ribosomal-protein-alanine N-acetyltransferase